MLLVRGSTVYAAGMAAYPIRTLSAPNGVTRIAGANAYAAKLATSPRATINPLAPVQSQR